MGGGARALVFLLAFVLLAGRVTPDESLQTKCIGEVQSVKPCIAYGTGETGKPDDKCCNVAKSVNDKNRVCLCYLIQQVYEGNPLVRAQKLQGPRLLELPKYCNFPNTSLSDCIGLLKILPGTPENGIFNGSVSMFWAVCGAGIYPGGDGFAIRARYSYAFASAVLSAVALSVFSN
ncbi:unnamed protein product [Spirodela intermedia]|uniref:Bifunctional inhibitor/plant lipid transfer protein/seed storage helical domain-containing protein n=1 Tax=Spirodela intermedia TaxID=51605 RepID=A0A7I8KST3_SPIIN|nr:unnamed protein product [Spirodela intermedia]